MLINKVIQLSSRHILTKNIVKKNIVKMIKVLHTYHGMTQYYYQWIIIDTKIKCIIFYVIIHFKEANLCKRNTK